MNPRASTLYRCIRCRMRLCLCVCELFPSRTLSNGLLVLIHEREYWKPSNTGHLARLISPQAKVVVWRYPTVRGKSLSLLESNKQPVVLFPSEGAEEFSSYRKRIKGKVQLIVPDGSWRQARKIIVRDTHLRTLPRVQLACTSLPSNYQLRQERRKGGMATFEAIARALGILESPTLQKEMEFAFSCMVERILWTRGRKIFSVSKESKKIFSNTVR